MPNLTYLKPIKTVDLASCGKDVINDHNELFSYIDSDFKNWNADEKGKKTKATKLAVLEMTKDATFEQMFNKDTDCLTQAQIVDFCRNHKDDLRQDGYATFFLFKSNEQYFVARVRVDSDGLDVRVIGLERGSVWRGSFAHRVVVPQLELETLEPEPFDASSLSPFEREILKRFDAALEICKKSLAK